MSSAAPGRRVVAPSRRATAPFRRAAAPSRRATAPFRPASVDFHFDLMCPYAYQASLWIREVRDRTGLTVNWRFFSLEEINRAEGKKHPWERDWSYGWSMMRIGALLRRRGMTYLDAEAAERVWDALVAWTEFPHLYEIQRPRTRTDAEQIASAFGPYLQARDWVSVNRGAVVDVATPTSAEGRVP